jgi:UDP-N-acetylmuramoyl-tripeptide--D-alanyl-D-alanine ligase
MIYLLFILFWFLREIKNTLFWLALWQIKEYRIDRFLAHFSTYKGKKIFLNFIFFSKIALLFLLLLFPNQFFFPTFLLLFLIYFFEVLKFFYSSFFRKGVLPIFTLKLAFLFLFNLFLFSFFFLYLWFGKIPTPNFLLFILTLDILTGILTSLSVLFFSPFTLLYKKILIKRATKKLSQFKDLITIGIVGSYGKTSTKEFLATILSEKFNVLKTFKNQNNEISIAKLILEKLKKEHQIFVCEMGAYKKGEIKKIVKMIKPKIGIITGLNEQHLELFKNMENLISAEGGKELVEFLPKNGVLILNGENKTLRDLYQDLKIKKKIVSKSNKDDWWAEKIQLGKDKIEFTISNKNQEKIRVKINLIGEHNIINILMAVCCARDIFKMEFSTIISAFSKFSLEQTGMNFYKTKYGFFVLESVYSTNPNAVFSHLDYLKIWEKKKVIIMPCLIELGKAAMKIHEKIGEKIKEVCDLGIITTYDYFPIINEKAKNKTIFLEDERKIFQKVVSFCREGDIVLLEGRVPKGLLECFNKIKAN